MSSVCKILLQASCPSFSLICFSLDVLGGLTVSFFLFSPLFSVSLFFASLSQTHICVLQAHHTPLWLCLPLLLACSFCYVFFSEVYFCSRMLLSDNTLFLVHVCHVFCGLWLPWYMFMWEVFSSNLGFFPPSFVLFFCLLCCSLLSFGLETFPSSGWPSLFATFVRVGDELLLGAQDILRSNAGWGLQRRAIWLEVCREPMPQSCLLGFLASQVAQDLPANAGDEGDVEVSSLGWGRSPEEEMATHSRILTWECMGRSPVGYRPRGCRAGHDWANGHAPLGCSDFSKRLSGFLLRGPVKKNRLLLSQHNSAELHLSCFVYQ